MAENRVVGGTIAALEGKHPGDYGRNEPCLDEEVVEMWNVLTRLSRHGQEQGYHSIGRSSDRVVEDAGEEDAI
ncbi:hypothetical protein AMTR_s00085p00054900 [Amborella trichopoda]|uniref:Uncharacterized protein n=1 Tax=Amborella trichopoda TaxID=13333 RepID=W1NYH0_AMBTC|nr:hypothetical protein AMTR_s00085p00054900 [Amborella trichopoda]